MIDQNISYLPKHVIDLIVENLDPISFLRFSITNQYFFKLCTTNMQNICYNNISILLGNADWQDDTFIWTNQWDKLASIANGDQIAQFVYDALPKINYTIEGKLCYCWGQPRNVPCFVTYCLDGLCIEAKVWLVEWLYINKNYYPAKEITSFNVELFYPINDENTTLYQHHRTDLHICIEYGMTHTSFLITPAILYRLLYNMISLQHNKQVAINIYKCSNKFPDWDNYWTHKIIPRLAGITNKIIQSSLKLSIKK
jgi:hypothetical protein